MRLTDILRRLWDMLMALLKSKGAIDSNAGDGYVTVTYTAKAEKRYKGRVSGGNESVTFDVLGTGTVFPLSQGNGEYTVTLYEELWKSRYRKIAEARFDASIDPEYKPYLHPNVYVSYTEESECAALAARLCEGAADEAEKFRAIYSWITGNISYDEELAADIESGAVTRWIPDPDAILEAGKSICMGSASLFAAMCRSQGIPAQVVTGSVRLGGEDKSHAWNEAYICGSWVRADAFLSTTDNTEYIALYRW